MLREFSEEFLDAPVGIAWTATNVRRALNSEPLAAAAAACRLQHRSKSGTSVADVIATVETITGQHVSVQNRPPVAKPFRLVADISKAAAELNWKPIHSDIDTIVRDAWSSGVAGS